MKEPTFCISLALALLAIEVNAENWPGWRGPTGDGHTTEKDLPLEWDSQTGENVLWKAPAGGLGHSTPVVWGDTVFLTTSSSQEAEEKGKVMPEHHVIAFRTRDGKQLWRTPITPGTSLCQWHEYAAPTPVTDGKALYVWFASGVAAAVDFEGKLICASNATTCPLSRIFSIPSAQSGALWQHGYHQVSPVGCGSTGHVAGVGQNHRKGDVGTQTGETRQLELSDSD